MEGIDVSIYQGDIDWSKIKGVDFAYLKASQGINSYDAKCKENALSISKTNIKFGYYHFATLNNIDVFNDAKQEANDFLTQLRDLPHNTITNALDIELNSTLKLSPDKVENWIHTYINTLAASGVKTIIYSYTPFLDENLPKNHTLGQYPLWIAQYSKTSFPKLPNGWNSYNIWQWGQIYVDGISGKVDANHARILV